MRNTYCNRNISLTVLALAIALSTSLSAAQVSAPARYAIQLDSFDEKLPPITVPAIGGVQTEIFLDKGRELASTYNFDKHYQFNKLTPTVRTPKEKEIIQYVAEQIFKDEVGYVDIVKGENSQTHYTYTPGELFVGKIQLAYINTYRTKGEKDEEEHEKFVWGVCTIDVKPGLAKRVQQLETGLETTNFELSTIEEAVSKEEQARKCAVSQLKMSQTQLAAVLSILNSRIDELNAKSVSWGEWFKWLWR